MLNAEFGGPAGDQTNVVPCFGTSPMWMDSSKIRHQGAMFCRFPACHQGLDACCSGSDARKVSTAEEHVLRMRFWRASLVVPERKFAVG
jgi:hypothetical protein